MSTYSFYKDLLTRLNVKNYSQVIKLLFDDDFQFYDNYRRKYKNKINNCIQEGGASTYMYSYAGYKFMIHQDKDENLMTFHIYNNDNVNDLTCVILLIELEEQFVNVQSISSLDNCAINGMPKTKKGTLLLHMVIDFIKKKLKPLYNLKYIQLKDNSFYFCQKNKTRIDFDSLYMLTKGDTWCGKHNFVPFNPNAKKIDLEMNINYKVNQRLVDIIKVKCVSLDKYLKATKLLSDNQINNIIKKYKNTSIKDFMNIFMEDYDKSCEIFSMIYKDLMKEMKLTNLHGITYFLPI